MKKTEKLVSALIILFVIRISLFKVRKETISLDIYTIIQIITVIFIFAILIFEIYHKPLRYKPIIKDNLFNYLLFTYTLGLLSYFWSALPLFSGYMALQNIVFLLAFFNIFSKKKSFVEIESLFIGFTFVLIFIDGLGDFVHYKSLSFLLNWHNLETGGLAGMLFCYSLAELVSKYKYKDVDLNRKKYLRKVAVISLLILILSTSSGSNISVLGGLLALTFLGENTILKALTVFSFIIIIIFPDIINSSLAILFPGKSMAGITSFGYRTHLWGSIWELFKQRPFFGWGYAAVERIGERYNVDSHNSFIGILGGLGTFGATLFVLSIVNLLIKTARFKNFIGYKGLFTAIVCLFVNSNTFGFLSSKTSLLTLGFFMLCSLSYYYKYIQFSHYDSY